MTPTWAVWTGTALILIGLWESIVENNENTPYFWGGLGIALWWATGPHTILGPMMDAIT